MIRLRSIIAALRATLVGCVRKSLRALDAPNGRLELLTEQAQNIAHDLRTPLSNLRCQTEVLLLRPRTVPEYEQLLAANLREYDFMSRMIDGVLLLGRMDRAAIAPSYASIDVHEHLRCAARQCTHLAMASHSEVRVRAQGHLRADPILFRRAVGNLLTNALQHAPRGALIDVVATRVARSVVICVSNPGQFDQTRSRSPGSTGLGLAIVRSIMALHQGHVWVDSSGGMTRFTLVFPDPPPPATMLARSTPRSMPRR